MKKRESSTDLLILQIVLLLIAGVIIFITNSYTIMFYYWCVLLGVSIIYYLYEYNVKNKNHIRMQLESLRNIRRQLYYALVLGVLVYSLLYNWLGYKSPIEDLFITLFGVIVIISIISLIFCIRMIRIKQQLINISIDDKKNNESI